MIILLHNTKISILPIPNCNVGTTMFNKVTYSGKHWQDETLVSSSTYLEYLEEKCLANGLTMGNSKDSVNLKTLVIIATYYATNIFRCTLHAYTGPLDPNAVSLYRSFTKSFLVKFGGFRTLGSDLPANDSGKKKRPSPSIIFTIYGRAGGKWILWGRYGSCTLWSFGRGPNDGAQEESMYLKVN